MATTGGGGDPAGDGRRLGGDSTDGRRLGGDYAKLWVASAVSNLGDGVRLAALPLLAATLTREPGPVAGVTLAGGLPWLLFALVGGAVVDRSDRRRVMWVANAVRTAVVAALAVAVATENASIPALYAAAFALGTAEVFFDNAAQSLLPAVVPRDRLEAANGRMYAAELVANSFVGPPLGGLLFAALAAAPFFADSASFAISALLVAALRGSFARPQAEGPRPRLRADVAEGLRWLWRHRLLRTLGLELGLLNMASSAWVAVEVLFALEVLGLDEVGYGLLFSAAAVGGVVGSLVAGRVSAALGPGPTLLGAVVLMGLPYVVIGLTSNAWVVAAMHVVLSVVSIAWNVITVSFRQAIIPDRLLGRVNSVYRLLGWGSMPVGAALGGWLAGAFGLRTVALAAGAAVTASAAVIWPVVNSRTIAAAREEAAAASA